MHLVTLPAQDKAFLVLLNQHPELDGRDPRGCRHSVALVLMGVLMALCSGRDANLSSIQRYMKSRFDGLCRRIGHQATQVVSRAQLPRLLAQVNQPVFAHLVQAHYGLQLTDEFSGWLSGNGKELRGSILKGKHRGDACVSIITQADQSIVAQAHYNGTKDSERPSVSNLLNINGLLNRKIVLDALHLTADLLESIDHHKGSYLIGFKSNQPHLFRLCFVQIMTKPPSQQRVDAPQRKHARIEERTYACFPISTLPMANRSEKAQLHTRQRPAHTPDAGGCATEPDGKLLCDQ